MRIGINIHSDVGGCPNLKWLRENTIIKNIRIDFPCRDTFGNSVMLKQLDDVLNLSDKFEAIVLHVGYLDEFNINAYKRFNSYIEYVIGRLVDENLAKKTILEIWNNVNLDGFWNKSEMEFRRMLSYLTDSLALARDKKIRFSGFSFTTHRSGWDWLRNLQDVLELYDFITIQLYPEKSGQYIELINRFEREYPGLNYIVTETGHMGNNKEQFCLYRQLMYEIEKATFDKLVFLYHLFDESMKDVWELISWQDGKVREKKAAIYLKQNYSLVALRANRPKSFFCCKQRKWWKKIICFFKRIF